MRFERLVDKASAGSPQDSLQSKAQIAAPVCAALTLLATFALWTLSWAPAGLQQLLLLCFVRLAVLACIGAASYRALPRRRGDTALTPGSGASAASAASAAAEGAASSSSRAALTQAALCLQLTWLATELLLGSALLVFHPYLLGPISADYPAFIGALLSVLPLVCAAAMSGCFLFLHRLTSRRRRGGRAAVASSPLSASLECGLAGHPSLASHHPAHYAYHSAGAAVAALQHHHQQQAAAAAGGGPGGAAGLYLAPASSSSLDASAASSSSPLSESGSFSSCSSSGASASYYPSPYGGSGSLSSASSGALLAGVGSGSGGAPSPTGHVRSRSEASAAAHQAALHAACEILLVEHQLDTKEYCLFVHKRLRPIRTRPEDKSRPAPEKPGLLRELITNSFTFQHDPELRAQLAASMAAATSAGGSASSITFQQAQAAAAGVEAM